MIMYVQDRLAAVHHLDVGWRPADMTQRNGRIIRQGNRNKQVQILQYVTEGTFDACLYQTLENKQKFISQIMTSKSPSEAVTMWMSRRSPMRRSRHCAPVIR